MGYSRAATIKSRPCHDCAELLGVGLNRCRETSCAHRVTVYT